MQISRQSAHEGVKVVSPAHRLGYLTDGAVASSSRLPKASNCATIGDEETVNNVKDGGWVLILDIVMSVTWKD